MTGKKRLKNSGITTVSRQRVATVNSRKTANLLIEIKDSLTTKPSKRTASMTGNRYSRQKTVSHGERKFEKSGNKPFDRDRKPFDRDRKPYERKTETGCRDKWKRSEHSRERYIPLFRIQTAFT